MNEKLNKLIEEYKKETEKECYEIKVEKEEPSILDDKIGGLPYLPVGEEYPKDKSGNPMPLLIQVNLKNIDLKDWPKEGILEIFIDKEVNWPCEYKIKYFKEDLEYQSCFPEIDLSCFITKEPIKISLEKTKSHMPLTNYSADDEIINAYNKAFNSNITTSNEIDKDLEGIDWYSEFWDKLEIPKANIGGYPDFTQSDPREAGLEGKDECLVKIDSNLDRRILIGDAGILFILISKEDLENGNLENAIVDWDCC